MRYWRRDYATLIRNARGRLLFWSHLRLVGRTLELREGFVRDQEMRRSRRSEHTEVLLTMLQGGI